MPETNRPLKRFGQHFLEPKWVERLIQVIAPTPTDVFIEIGPGRGALTRPLAAAAAHVAAFEIDRRLAADLRAASVLRLHLVEADFLKVTRDQIRSALPAPPGPALHRLRVAGNLPYNVGAPILFKCVDLYAEGLPVTDATVMLQREVADRLLARPGSKGYGVLTVLIGHWADADRLLSLPPGAFRPVPKVHSSVVRLRFHPARPPVANQQRFRSLVQAVFTRRRKTIANALLAYTPSAHLSPAVALKRADIDGRRRPETLEIAEFVRLCEILATGSDRGQTPV